MEIEKLIEILRGKCAVCKRSSCNGKYWQLSSCPATCEAADALEQLQAENDRLKEEVQQMRWVPVEERFPEDRLPAGRKQITVMVATKAGKVTIASRVFEPEREYYGKKYPARWVWSRWLNHYVTHWMPLPSPPKEEKK